MKKKYKVTAFLLSLIISLSFCINVSATGVKSYTNVASGVTNTVMAICSNANATVGEDILVCTGRGTLSFDQSKYIVLSQEDKEAFMEQALRTTKSSSLGTKTKNQVYNFIAQQDTSVSAAIKYIAEDTATDFANARKWIRPFSNTIGTVMGIVSLLIFLFLSLTMTFDIAYLVLPGIQLILERGEDNKRPFGVSNEAWKANRQVEQVNEAENVLSIYLKKRIPSIILVCITLGYLVSGKIYDIFVFFAEAFNI